MMGYGNLRATPERFRAFLRQIGAVLRHLLLAAVPAERVFRLRTLDPDRFEWVAVNRWPEAVETIRAKPVDMAVVDPLLGGDAGPMASSVFGFSSPRSRSWSIPISLRPTPACCSNWGARGSGGSWSIASRMRPVPSGARC